MGDGLIRGSCHANLSQLRVGQVLCVVRFVFLCAANRSSYHLIELVSTFIDA